MLAGDHAGHVRAFVGAAVVGAQVVGGLVAGGVLELHVLAVGGDLEHRLHVAEGGAEDQLVALATMSRITRSASADSGTFSTKLVTTLSPNSFSHRLAAVVVREGPAAVAHRADVGEGDLQRLGLGAGGARRRRGAGAGAGAGSSFLPQPPGRRGHGGQGRQLEQGTFLQVGHVRSFLGRKVGRKNAADYEPG
jgi:hypothetical protein